MEAFARIDLGREPVPDETTICRFRHLLERHGLGPALLEEVNAYFAESGLRVGRGTIVDATIIAAPNSTKNAAGKRDPEMHQTMKGNEWHFGMKAHIGVDSKLKIVHSFAATTAICLRSCCTAMRRGSGATQHTAVKRRRSASARPPPPISRIATRPAGKDSPSASASGIVRRPASAPESSMRSTSSSESSAS